MPDHYGLCGSLVHFWTFSVFYQLLHCMLCLKKERMSKKRKNELFLLPILYLLPVIMMCRKCVERIAVMSPPSRPQCMFIFLPSSPPSPHPHSSSLNSRLATSLGNLYVITGDSRNHHQHLFASSSPSSSPSFPVPRATFASISALAANTFHYEVNNNSDQYSASNGNSKISAFSNHNHSNLGGASTTGRFGLAEQGQNPLTAGLSRPSARYLSRSIPVSELVLLFAHPCICNSSISFSHSFVLCHSFCSDVILLILLMPLLILVLKGWF